jgi:hypothetical protein
MKILSVAYWPKDKVNLFDPQNRSTDSHHSEDYAKAICERLWRDGFGGDRQIFPIKVAVEVDGVETWSFNGFRKNKN